MTIINHQKIKLLTRNGLNWTYKFPSLVKTMEDIPISSAILDGELVAVDKHGMSHFQLLQNSIRDNSEELLQYYIFDLLYCNGYDLRKLPLLDRKAILKKLIPNNEQTSVLFSEFIQNNGALVYQKACKNKLEGIVSKHIQSPYEQHRSRQWLKTKCIKRQEFVIGGFTQPKGSRHGFGSLLIGLYNNRKQFIYHGHVGTGFDNDTLQGLYAKLTKLIQKNNPFYDLHEHSIIKNVVWVKPELVAELEFTEWTKDSILRHPSFLGLRLDKMAKGVRAEHIEATIPVSGINLSHPDRIIEVCRPVTKRELAEYYQKISAHILPHLINRPLTLLRCPSASKVNNKKTCFYHKHYVKSFATGVYPISIKEKENNKEEYLMIKDLQGLIALVQFNVTEIHPWGSSIKTLEKPDRITLDLDPDENIPWKNVIKGALVIRKELKKSGLTSYVKTSGGKGLHIVIPIMPKNTWAEVKNFTETFSRYMAEKYPTQFTATITKTKRLGKIFIDYLRNSRGATAVAPYSTRAKAAAPISTPVSWEELKKIKSSQQFTVANIFKRVSKIKKDPWQGFFQCKQQLPIST